jgi:hypothetical protein
MQRLITGAYIKDLDFDQSKSKAPFWWKGKTTWN